jgi:hypothetical protein
MTHCNMQIGRVVTHPHMARCGAADPTENRTATDPGPVGVPGTVPTAFFDTAFFDLRTWFPDLLSVGFAQALSDDEVQSKRAGILHS